MKNRALDRGDGMEYENWLFLKGKKQITEASSSRGLHSISLYLMGKKPFSLSKTRTRSHSIRSTLSRGMPADGGAIFHHAANNPKGPSTHYEEEPFQ